jgi:drug/metabolite transporter (DMT)-like permease
MTPLAIGLITVSAFSHAFWNFLGKRREPSLAFFLFANTTAALALSPLLIIFRDALPKFPPTVWLMLLVTGLFQTIYFSGLAGAYKRGDMSLAYPLARAVPVVLVALISLLLGRGDQIGRLGIGGMLLVSAGCLLLPLPRFARFRPRDYLTAAGLMALVAAVGTTGYTLIDDEALRRLRDSADLGLSTVQITMLFITLEAASISLVQGVSVMTRRDERRALGRIWRQYRAYAAVTGLIILGTYSLVLLAMAFVDDVSYVAAFRQLSIPIGAVLGMTLQREPRYRPKIVGIVTVFVGLLMVGLG